MAAASSVERSSITIDAALAFAAMSFVRSRATSPRKSVVDTTTSTTLVTAINRTSSEPRRRLVE
jgi:hypothetical protein